MTTLLIDVAGWVGMALLIGAYASSPPVASSAPACSSS
jgi:hypothetical protein